MTQIVVIGADAAGASAASGIKRLQPDWDVIMCDAGEFSSYAACGLPYWAAGQIPHASALIARTPDQHKANGIDVRMGHTATNIDTAAGTVTVRSSEGEQTLGYDGLVIATGAEPLRPPIPGIDAPNVYAVHTIPGVQPLLDAMPPTGSKAVVVGAGFIGLEMAEAFLDRGLEVTVVDLAEHPMVSLDADMGQIVAEQMSAQGITGVFGQGVVEIKTSDAGEAFAVETESHTFPCDVVVLALGVRPRVAIAAEAGLPLGHSGGIATDDRQLVAENIYAAGDCVDTYHRLLGHTVVMPLGTHANKQGRIAGINLAGGDETFPGIIGTAITKVGRTCIARTGLTQRQCDDSGFNARSATITSAVIASYMPDPGRMMVKVTAARDSGRLLGAQIVGDRALAAKRIDTLATAIWNSMTASDLMNMDLSYAPPFSPVWDPVQMAARRLLATSD
jgi:NADPH-dependent 2,4-dienoyl-CoA reductase/sulfur reductase-like enzyme